MGGCEFNPRNGQRVELTCQHVDPQTSLPPGQDATLEVKILVLRGSLNNVLEKALLQRNFLK